MIALYEYTSTLKQLGLVRSLSAYPKTIPNIVSINYSRLNTRIVRPIITLFANYLTPSTNTHTNTHTDPKVPTKPHIK